MAPPELVFRVTVSAGTYVRAAGPRSRRAAGGRRPSDRAPPGGDRRAAGRGRGAARRGWTRTAVRPPARCSATCPAVELDEPGGAAVSHGRAVPDGGAAMDPGDPSRCSRGTSWWRWRGPRTAGSGRRWCWRRHERSAAPPTAAPARGEHAVTVGSFDGVHLGHQAVLREIARRAAAAGRASVLVTFEPHPLEVVNPAGRAAAPDDRAPSGARSWPRRRWTTCYFLRFDRRVAGADARRSSCARSCSARCRMRELVIGHDHGFGRGRSGDVETLRRLGADRTASTWTWSPPVDVGEPARLQLADPPGGGRRRSRHARPGMLGRPYQVSGRGGHGASGGGGRSACPTINLPTCRRRSCCRPTGSTPCGSSGGAAGPGG